MRLRSWIAVLVSVVLLLAMGTIGILVNRSALRAADTVHRADTRALAVNNATLAGQVQMLSAAELNEFPSSHTPDLGKNSPADRAALTAFAAKTTFFQYGLALTDFRGNVLTATRTSGLPPATDPGYAPMRRLLLSAKPGFSSVMTIDGAMLQAVAVPITAGGKPVAILIGYNDVTKTQLQKYVVRLSAETHFTAIVDSTGRVGATSEPSRIGQTLDSAIVTAMAGAKAATFLEYRVDGTKMIAILVPDLPGGWFYVRTQTMASFDGAVHSRSQTINLTLLAMLLIGVVGISFLGYRTQVQRRRSDERFQALFQHAPDMVSVLDGKGKIAYSSPSSAKVLGFPAGSTQGKSVFELVHADDLDHLRAEFGTLLTERDGVLRLQCRVLTAAGTYRWFDITASNQMHNPALSGVVINARDISETRAFQERLTHEAEHDPLTGLPNRRRMQDALGTSLAGEAVAVLFVDLDGFKPVNDAHGHEAGDDLLRQVAERLSACIREKDVLSRVGGDEFVVLMPGVFDHAAADAMSARLRASVDAPFLVAGTEITISASVGVHMAPSTSDPDQALRAADHAMYAMKHAGGGRASRRPVAATAHSGRHRSET